MSEQQMNEHGVTLPGWWCSAAGCGLFNGEAKEPRRVCRGCGVAKSEGDESVPRRDTILSLHDKGYTVRSIAERVGLSRSRVHAIVSKERQRRLTRTTLGLGEKAAVRTEEIAIAVELAEAKATIAVLQEENRRLAAAVAAPESTAKRPAGGTQLRTDVQAFHRRFGHPIADVPAVPDAATLRFRLALAIEEFGEMLQACGSAPLVDVLQRKYLADLRAWSLCVQPEVVDLPALVDALADLDYVIEGFRVVLGVHGSPIARAVQNANMAKEPVLKSSFTAAEWKALADGKRCVGCGASKRAHTDAHRGWTPSEGRTAYSCPQPSSLSFAAFTSPDPARKPTKPAGWSAPNTHDLLVAQGWKP